MGRKVAGRQPKVGLGIDPELRRFATEREKQILDAIEETGSATAAARKVGLAHQNVYRSVQALQARAARFGHSPEADAKGEAPPGFRVRGKSTYYDRDGKIRGQWLKTQADADQREAALQAAADALAATLPRAEPVPPPAVRVEELCTVYTLTDAHVGMLAWHREAGEDWDLDIAEATIIGCFAEAIRSTPAAGVAVFAQLGDFLHYDSLRPETPTSGHLLDADGRFPKMVEAAVRILRRVIQMLLEKHQKLHVIMAEGNHDMASSVWLRTMFKALLENEPRVTVDDSALPYYVLEFGEVMLAWHHSHLKKMEGLPQLMAAQFPQIWGRTRWRYVSTGDKHHASEKEHPGIMVIQHPTLAARDAYAARGGWFANRAMSAITFHRRYGQVGRVTVTPEMLKGEPVDA